MSPPLVPGGGADRISDIVYHADIRYLIFQQLVPRAALGPFSENGHNRVLPPTRIRTISARWRASAAARWVSAEGFGPTGHEVGDGAPMRRQHRRAMDLEVVGAEAAEHVRDFDHDRAARSKAGHDFVEESAQRGPCGFGQMGINGRGRDIGMA